MWAVDEGVCECMYLHTVFVMRTEERRGSESSELILLLLLLVLLLLLPPSGNEPAARLATLATRVSSGHVLQSQPRSRSPRGSRQSQSQLQLAPVRRPKKFANRRKCIRTRQDHHLVTPTKPPHHHHHVMVLWSLQS